MALTERFWEDAYAQSGYCWGLAPSCFVQRAIPAVEQHTSIVELGCGYGRDLLYLARKFPRAGFAGVDISTNALALLRKLAGQSGGQPCNLASEKWDVNTAPPLPPSLSQTATCLLCHSLVHLLSARERRVLLSGLAEAVRPRRATLLLSAYSRHDSKFGTGEQVAGGTYRCSERFPAAEVHFFDADELAGELREAGWRVHTMEVRIQ